MFMSMSTLPPLNLTVGIDSIFTEMPFEQRLEHVADQGFTAFEFGKRDGKDMNITLALKTALRLEVSAFLGSTSSLVDAMQHAQFENEIMRSASLAVDLSCSHLIVYSGTTLSNVPRIEQHNNIVAGLRTVVPIAQDAGVTLLLEPLNPIDHPGNYLISSKEGLQIIREVNSPHVRLLFNIYHQQISEGNLSARLINNLDMVGYIHVADVPGKHEPGTGEINYRYLFRLLREQKFQGFVGLDYIPLGNPVIGLKAVRAMSQ